MVWNPLKILLFCGICLPTLQACFVKQEQAFLPIVSSIPCRLNMEIIHHLPNHTISAGSLIMSSGTCCGGSYVANLTEGKSSSMTFNGRKKEWPSRYFPTPYCKDDNGNWTGGTILINIYEGFDYNYSTPIKAYLGLKFNAACQTECNDWIQLTISSSRDFITREYFYEDPSTTVINGIRDSISGYRNKAVNFVMTLRNRPSAAAIVENQDLVVSAKLEKETTGNRVMKVIAYPNTGQPVVIADANI